MVGVGCRQRLDSKEGWREYEKVVRLGCTSDGRRRGCVKKKVQEREVGKTEACGKG